MENKLKIKLKIGNRVYPLTINPDQEQNLRESAKKIELLVEKLENLMRFEISKTFLLCVRFSLPHK